MAPQYQKLPSDTPPDDFTLQTTRPPSLMKRIRTQTSFTNLALILYSITVTTLLIASQVIPSHRPAEPYSLARTVLAFDVQREESTSPSIYSQEPSRQHDIAWHDLLRPMDMSLSYDEVAGAGVRPEDQLKLEDGGYWGTLAVYHELHCLRRMKWYIHDDVYFPNMTTEKRVVEREHGDHCIEQVRRSLMCSANTALWTSRLTPGVKNGVHTSQAERRCVKWDPLHAWANERAIGT